MAFIRPREDHSRRGPHKRAPGAPSGRPALRAADIA
jgi:hypothetical protein